MINCGDDYLLSVGDNGFDFYIHENCHQNNMSFASFGDGRGSFEVNFSGNNQKGYLAGESNFRVKEIEVFKLQYEFDVEKKE